MQLSRELSDRIYSNCLKSIEIGKTCVAHPMCCVGIVRVENWKPKRLSKIIIHTVEVTNHHAPVVSFISTVPYRQIRHISTVPCLNLRKREHQTVVVHDVLEQIRIIETVVLHEEVVEAVLADRLEPDFKAFVAFCTCIGGKQLIQRPGCAGDIILGVVFHRGIKTVAHDADDVWGGNPDREPVFACSIEIGDKEACGG